MSDPVWRKRVNDEIQKVRDLTDKIELLRKNYRDLFEVLYELRGEVKELQKKVKESRKRPKNTRSKKHPIDGTHHGKKS